MKEAFERLWNGYLCDECVAIDTDSERLLMKKAADLHESVDALLSRKRVEPIRFRSAYFPIYFADFFLNIRIFFKKIGSSMK